jgi:NAD(P)-dependent dehydrogenase (short-subunit alcohol dehydrogenase family)
MNQFVASVERGSYEQEGWPRQTYAVSKIGVTALTQLLAREEKRNVIICCCCPGYVNTDMTSHKGTKTVEEGADTPAYLASLPPDAPKERYHGKFFQERKEISWEKDSSFVGPHAP